MSNVIPFNVSFDGTNMTVDQIQEEARKRGWPGLHIDTRNFLKTGKLIVRRLTEKVA